MKNSIQALPKPIRQHGWWVFIVIILIGLAWRPVRVMHLQGRAGNRIEAYIRKYANAYEHYFTCQIPVLAALPEADEGLDQAVVMLTTARTLDSDNAHTNLLLGRAACLQGDFFLAVYAFDNFSQARPDNPLGRLETAFAYISATLVEEDVSGVVREAFKNQARQQLEHLAIEETFFPGEADQAYQIQAFDLAWYWYRVGAVLRVLSEEQILRLALLSAIFDPSQPIEAPFDAHEVLMVNDSLRITPEDFFRLADGQPVAVRTYDDKPAAVYYTNSDPGGVFIQVETGGQYCLSIEALDRPPKMTTIAVTLNLEELRQMELTRGDDTLWRYLTQLPLEEGLHLLGFRLTNDLFKPDENIDRNAYVGEVVIALCENE